MVAFNSGKKVRNPHIACFPKTANFDIIHTILHMHIIN